MKISRRRTLQMIGVLLAFAKAQPIQSAGNEIYATDTEGFGLHSIFDTRSGKESAAAIGEVFLRQYDRDLRQDELVNLIMQSICRVADLSSEKLSDQFDRTTLRRLIVDAISYDFSQGYVLEVDGWLLAETEVRLCALVFLVNEDPRISTEVRNFGKNASIVSD